MRGSLTSHLALIPVLAAVCVVAGSTLPVPLHAQAGVRERTMFVSAVDSRGQVVEDLSPDDFVVTEDGRRREILRVSHALEPIDIAVLVDNSAASQKAIPSIRTGLRQFVQQMAVGNQIALIALADRPTILVDYTSTPERLEQGIGRLFAMSGSGMTLLDAITEVSSGLRRRESPRVVIVPVITNGAEFTNRYARDVIGSLRQAGASLHGIVVGTLGLGTTEERERAITFDEGTRTTGGQHVTLLTETAIEQALLKLARELSAQYKVVYGRPESLIPPEKIVVTSARAGVTMRGTPARGQTGA
jgi:VWFA-related protein